MDDLENGKGMNLNSSISGYKGMKPSFFALSMMVRTTDTAVINNDHKIIGERLLWTITGLGNHLCSPDEYLMLKATFIEEVGRWDTLLQ